MSIQKSKKSHTYVKNIQKKSIYLDYASATPLDKKVKKVIRESDQLFANASAIHSGGVKVRTRIEESRKLIASLISAHTDEIIFTGSGTESVALAIMGVVRMHTRNIKPHVITSLLEHAAVLETCRMLVENNEASVTYIAPDEHGIIDPKNIREALTEHTVLVSIMYANNEIGTIQPIEDIAKAIRHARKHTHSILPLFHTDACQAMNYLATSNIEKLGVDLMSFNSSKIYGPKGIGALYKKRNVELAPLYGGGGQEFGLRSGTESISLMSGFATALEETSRIKEKESKRLVVLRDYGIKKLLALSKISGYDIILNGDVVHRLPNNINISISDISSELLVIELDAKGIHVSAKSACKSAEPDESYVIIALRTAQHVSTNNTDGSLRISLGQGTTKRDIDTLTHTLKDILNKYNAWK